MTETDLDAVLAAIRRHHRTEVHDVVVLVKPMTFRQDPAGRVPGEIQCGRAGGGGAVERPATPGSRYGNGRQATDGARPGPVRGQVGTPAARIGLSAGASRAPVGGTMTVPVVPLSKPSCCAGSKYASQVVGDCGAHADRCWNRDLWRLANRLDGPGAPERPVIR